MSGIRRITTLYTVIMFCIIAVVLCLCISNNALKNNSDFADYSANWVTSDGNVFDFNRINKSVDVYKVIEDVDHDVVLFFRAKNINVQVYKNGELCTDYTENQLKGYKTPGTYFVYTPVSAEDNGKVLNIHIECPYSNDSSCNIKSMYLGDKLSIYSRELRGKLGGACTCLMIILIGTICILLAYLLRKCSNGLSLLLLGVFSINIGVWSLTETKILQLIFGWSSYIHLVTGLLLLIMVLPILIFFHAHYNAKMTWVVYSTSIITFAIFGLCVLLHIFRVLDLHETIRLAHLNIIIGICSAFYYALCCYFRSGFKNKSIWGLVTIGVCAGVDIVLYYLQLINDNSTFTRIGVLGYIVFFGIDIIQDYLDNYKLYMKSDVLRKMAYFDILTDFYNRTSFDEDVRGLENDNTSNRIIGVFDVNNLKAVNDNFGHLIGDKFIIEASGYIKDTFNSIGKCYRVGGDEFVVITKSGVTTETFGMLCDNMRINLNRRNRTNNEYKLEIAYGYSVIADKTVKEAFDDADKDMYKCKKALKEAAGKSDI